MLDNLYAYSFSNEVNLCDFGTCFDVNSGALTSGTLYPESGQIRDGGYESPPSSIISIPKEVSSEDSLIFGAYLSEASTVTVDLSTISTCTNTATGYDMFNFGYQLLIIEKNIVLDRIEDFKYLDTYTSNIVCETGFTSNWAIQEGVKTYRKVLSGTGIDRIPVGSYRNIQPPGDVLTVKYFLPEGNKSTYIGFGASTGAFFNAHWIHDFQLTSDFNIVNMNDILNNSNLIGSAQRVDNSIRLTPAEMEKVGNFFYNNPMIISDSLGRLVDWTVYFVYSIEDGDRGDGLSFILQNKKNIGGVTGGGVGYGGINNSLGVLYDTYQNIEVGEPNNNHIKLCLNGSVGLPLITQPDPGLDLKGPDNLINGPNNTVYYRYNWITYSGKTKTLNVYISNTFIKPPNPVLSFYIDLRSNILIN